MGLTHAEDIKAIQGKLFSQSMEFTPLFNSAFSDPLLDLGYP